MRSSAVNATIGKSFLLIAIFTAATAAVFPATAAKASAQTWAPWE